MRDDGLIGYFARHRVAANLLMLMVLCAGLFCLPQLKHTLTPDIHFPALELSIEWPGAGAEAVTTELLEPIESRLRQVEGVRSTMSNSMLGLATINIVLAHDADPLAVRPDVLSAVESLRNLPVGIAAPRVRAISFDERAVRLGLTGAALPALHEEALAIRDALLEGGIPRVDVDGWAEPQLEISIAGDQLQALGMSLQAIATALRAQLNVNAAGSLWRDGDGLVVSSRAARLDERALSNVEIAHPNGSSLRLGDVASIKWRDDGNRKIARVNGEEGLVLTLYRSLDSDTLDVSERVHAWLKTYRAAQPGSRLVVLEDASSTVIANRDMLIGNAITGLLIVFGVLWLVLGRHSAFWTAAGIPVVVFATLLVLLWTGQTINMFTVAAFIMVLGVCVDDAIVVSEESEALARQQAQGLVSLEAARRMASPVFAAALTTIAAFVPLLFLPGMIGAALAPIAIVVIAAITASTIECFLILPAHLRGGPPAEPSRRPPIGDRWLTRARDAARPLMVAAVARSGRTLWIAAAGLLLAAVVAILLFNSDDAELDNDNIRTILYLEAATPYSERLRIVQQLEQSLREAVESTGEPATIVKSWSVIERETSGRPWLEAVVSLAPSTERGVSSGELISRWGTHLPPSSWVRSYGMETGKDKPSTSISWKLSGKMNLGELQAATEEFRARLQLLPEIQQVEDSFSQGAQQLEFSLNAQGRALGLDEASIAAQLHAAYEGVWVGRMPHAGSEADLRVKVALDERRADRVAQFPVQTPQGANVPLWSVATLSQQAATTNLARIDGHPEVSITAHLQPKFIPQRAELQRRIDREVLADIEQRYQLRRGLSPLEQDRQQLVDAVLLTFLISTLAIYLIMVWSLQSFVWPLLIVAVIPLGIAGSVYSHWLTGIPFGVFSLFGLLGMIGVVVNDAIVYMTRYREIRPTMPIRDAVVAAGTDRFRAIWLTTGTTVLGTVPLLFDSSPNAYMFKPMLVSFTGGLVAGSVLLLLVLPSMLCRVEEFWARRRESLAAALPATTC